MATAKRWWNGSAWVTTADTTCVYSEPGGSSAWARVRYTVKIIAYDDATVSMVSDLRSTSGYGTPFITSGTKTMKYGDSTIGTGSFTEDITSYITSISSSVTFHWSGNVSCGMNEYSTTTYHSGAPNNDSGNIVVTSNPFFHVITYNDNGGIEGPGIQAQFVGDSPTISLVEPIRTNRTFLGWATSSTARTAEYSPGDPITLTSDITLYAVWYPADDGFAQSISVTYNNSTILTIPDMITTCPIIYNGLEIATVSGAMTKTLNCQGKVMLSNVGISSRVLNCGNKYMATNIIVTGANAIYATIDVKAYHFPSGSTITINPDYTYSTETIIDGVRFNVTRAATYTITASSTNATKTATVVISSYGQVELVEFEYRLYLLTGNPIDYHTDVTREWNASNTRYSNKIDGAQRVNPTVDATGDYLTLTLGSTSSSGTGNRTGVYQAGTSSNGLGNDLSGYSKLVLKYDLTTTGVVSQYRSFSMGIFASKTWVWASYYILQNATNSIEASAVQAGVTRTDQTLELPISNTGGYKQVGINLRQGSNNGVKGTVTVKELYAEP